MEVGFNGNKAAMMEHKDIGEFYMTAMVENYRITYTKLLSRTYSAAYKVAQRIFSSGRFGFK